MGAFPGFTGKEEDVEVGLQYFGKRYYAPLLGRWISADPLAVHDLGADANLYAYVSGGALKSVDPMGLEGEESGATANAGLGTVVGSSRDPADNTTVVTFFDGHTQFDVDTGAVMFNADSIHSTGVQGTNAASSQPKVPSGGAEPGPGPSGEAAVNQDMLVGAALAKGETPDAIRTDGTGSKGGVPGGGCETCDPVPGSQEVYVASAALGAAIGAILAKTVTRIARAVATVGDNIAEGMEALSRPAINFQKQMSHVEGSKSNLNRIRQGKPTSSFYGEGSGRRLTEIAHQRGKPVAGRPNVKEHDFGFSVGTGPGGGSQTRVRVHQSPKTGKIHGHPSGPEKK